jgi:tricorn protease
LSVRFISVLAFAAAGLLSQPAVALAQAAPHILQQPAMGHDLIAFSYAGDIWTVPRCGGRATRITTGVGVEIAEVTKR